MRNLYKHKLFLSIAILVLVYIISRGYLISTKTTLDFDEGITMVGASGNLPIVSEQLAKDSGYFSELRSQETLANYLFLPKNGLDFKSVYTGQRNYDIHPPMYFYMLHVFINLFGNNLSVLLFLNVLIEVLSIFMLWKILNLLNISANKSVVLLVFFIIMSPTVIALGMFRQYYLLFLAILLCTSGALLWTKNGFLNYKTIILLIAGITIGLSTHFAFSLFLVSILACFSFFHWRLYTAKSGFYLVFIALISLGLVEVFNPGFVGTMLKSGEQRKSIVEPSLNVATIFLENGSFFMLPFLKNFIGKEISLILELLILFGSFILVFSATRKNKGLAMVYFPVLLFFLLTAAFCFLGYFPWRVLFEERYKLSFAFITLAPLLVLLNIKQSKVYVLVIILFLNQIIGTFYNLSLEKSEPTLPKGNFVFYKPNRGLFGMLANLNEHSNVLIWKKDIEPDVWKFVSKPLDSYIIIFKKNCSESEVDDFAKFKRLNWVYRDCICFKMEPQEK